MLTALEAALTALLVGGPQDFTLTMPVRPDTSAGQRLLAERALEICRGRYPLLGRYRFSGDERAGPDGSTAASYEVVQELTCQASPPPPATEARAPDGWRAEARDEADARAATARYFAAVDAGDAARVHAMWIASQQSEMPLAERAAVLQRFRAEAGAPGRHRIAGLTWYVNPPSAPRPGIYVAADYERSYRGLYLNCGYLVWLREGPGRYVLVREETGSVGLAQRPRSAEEGARIRTLLNCPAQ